MSAGKKKEITLEKNRKDRGRRGEVVRPPLQKKHKRTRRKKTMRRKEASSMRRKQLKPKKSALKKKIERKMRESVVVDVHSKKSSQISGAG